MVALTTHRTDAKFSHLRVCGRALVIGIVLLIPGVVYGQEARPYEEGRFIAVSTPLNQRVFDSVRAAASNALGQKDRKVSVLVFDFNPGNRSAASDDYGACYNLAKFILSLQDVSTIAFVHQDVTGHQVLPVLACSEIVMAREAKLGDVLQGKKGPLPRQEAGYYEDIANDRGRCPALILKMLDRNVEVVAANRGGAPWYIDKRREAEEKLKNIIVTSPEPVVPAGEIGLYTGRRARELGLALRLVESRQELVQAYRLPPSSLRDPLQGRTPIARRVELRGEFTKGASESFVRRVRAAVGQQGRANFILVELNCEGGDLGAARDTAEFLRNLKDDAGVDPVMTLAYVPKSAPDTAAILALGCTEIVMHVEAKFGSFERLAAKTQDTKLLSDALEGLAKEQGYPHLVARGFLDKDIVLHRVRTKKGTVERRIATAEELKQNEAEWADEGRIKHADQLLELDAELAKELGIARHVIKDPAELYTLYGLDPAEVRLSGPDWLDRISEFLRQPWVAVLLIMVGITCLILELKMPGVGLPGVIAALCFVLYFWAHSQLSGQIMWLAILLFLLGLILIGLEVFVIPGFGFTGLSGVLLIITSLALVTLEKKPETSQEWLNFGGTLSGLGLSLIGALILAIFAVRALPSLPYANRFVLQPPGEGNLALEEAGLQAADASGSAAALALLGAIGVSVTPLRPSGIARFGDEFVDVVAEGTYVETGSRVQVIEIEGNRIAVKEV